MSNTSKMDTFAVFEMFETINNKLDKQANISFEPTQIDLSAVNVLTERFRTITLL